MNERILELARQVWPDPSVSHVNHEKFAELIVRECIDKITTYDLVPGHSAKWEDIYDIHTRLLQDLGEELKEHFGVEQ
jgi:hypothetical protein